MRRQHDIALVILAVLCFAALTAFLLAWALSAL